MNQANERLVARKVNEDAKDDTQDCHTGEHAHIAAPAPKYAHAHNTHNKLKNKSSLSNQVLWNVEITITKIIHSENLALMCPS